jgi:hypothetical protein
MHARAMRKSRSSKASAHGRAGVSPRAVMGGSGAGKKTPLRPIVAVGFPKKFLSELSGGMRKRVGICARAHARIRGDEHRRPSRDHELLPDRASGGPLNGWETLRSGRALRAREQQDPLGSSLCRKVGRGRGHVSRVPSATFAALRDPAGGHDDGVAQG